LHFGRCTKDIAVKNHRAKQRQGNPSSRVQPALLIYRHNMSCLKLFIDLTIRLSLRTAFRVELQLSPAHPHGRRCRHDSLDALRSDIVCPKKAELNPR
jgi:hypothetical protein